MQPRSRVWTLFHEVLRRAGQRTRLVRRLRPRFCALADALHQRRWRLFAHSNHVRDRICFAHAAEEALTDREIMGMTAHELGHVVADAIGMPAHVRTRFKRSRGTPKPVQQEADWIARQVFGIPIRYNRRTLQELA